MSRRRATMTEFETAILGRMDTLEQHQAQPKVNGWFSGIVAASPESIAGVSIALASVPIALVGAGAGTTLKLDPISCAQIAGTVLSAGAGFGTICLGAGAIDLVEILDNFSERYFDYRERRDERKAQEKNATREVPVFSHGEQVGYTSIPEVTEFKVKTLIIPSTNMANGQREIAVDKVCLFLKTAVASGNWSRDTQAVLNKKEHPDVKKYLEGRSFWKLTPPTLHRACTILRGGGTNGAERDGTNGDKI